MNEKKPHGGNARRSLARSFAARPVNRSAALAMTERKRGSNGAAMMHGPRRMDANYLALGL